MGIRASKWFLVAISVTLVMAWPASGSAKAAGEECAGADGWPGEQASLDAFSTSVLCVLNAERTERGLDRLASNRQLLRAATGHSVSMGADLYFGHGSPDGASLEDRVERAGYLRGARVAWFLSENIGWGSGPKGTPLALVEAWMNSPEHRANVLSRRFEQVGVGAAWGAPFKGYPAPAVFATIDFGLLTSRARAAPGGRG